MSTLKRILVPTDFSNQSQVAIDYACDLAIPSKADLHLIHVVRESPRGSSSTDHCRLKLEAIANSLDEREELSIHTTKRVIVGEPQRVILDYAQQQDIDLIVMGTHGRTGLYQFALGSVTERVVRQSNCPVLVVGQRGIKVTLANAAAAIMDEFGDSFSSHESSGLEQMQTFLEKTFHIPTTTSASLIEDLQQREWIRWEAGNPGTWHCVEGVEFLEDDGRADRLTHHADSQAIDLIERGRRLRATDIHLDPSSDSEVMVRLRIDGKLEEYCRLHHQVAAHLTNQLKTLSHLDIAEPFLPKEGRVRLPTYLSDLEVRITTAPVAAGEAVALRLFDRENIFLPLESLGLTDRALKAVNEMLTAGEGIVLVTGPTGSGKTTTVYSMLETLGGIDKNVVSVEDPVEFAVPFVRQMNVDVKHGITMTHGLRTVLRMDPDVVFVGEIRDDEAARISMRAASSGKYVLSTLHTRDVASAVTALRDMGIPDRSVAANVMGIINQRLVRRLCTSCKQATPVTPLLAQRFQEANVNVQPRSLFRLVATVVVTRDFGAAWDRLKWPPFMAQSQTRLQVRIVSST